MVVVVNQGAKVVFIRVMVIDSLLLLINVDVIKAMIRCVGDRYCLDDKC